MVLTDSIEALFLKELRALQLSLNDATGQISAFCGSFVLPAALRALQKLE